MFGSHGRYRTEMLAKGDVGYIPQSYGHSIENVGDKGSQILIGFTATSTRRSICRRRKSSQSDLFWFRFQFYF
jgi:oxalate decarboxylase/phosphoglucose isomerase-like protein (cupin superfamily)